MSEPVQIQRFALFMGDNYYPLGGQDDFVCAGDSAEELRKQLVQKQDDRDYRPRQPRILWRWTGLDREAWCDWWQIADRATGKTIASDWEERKGE